MANKSDLSHRVTLKSDIASERLEAVNGVGFIIQPTDRRAAACGLDATDRVGFVKQQTDRRAAARGLDAINRVECIT